MNGFCLGQHAQLILGNLFQTVKALCFVDALLDHFCVVGFQIGKDSQLSDGSEISNILLGSKGRVLALKVNVCSPASLLKWSNSTTLKSGVIHDFPSAEKLQG